MQFYPSLEVIDSPECGPNCDQVGYIVFDRVEGEYVSGEEHLDKLSAVREMNSVMDSLKGSAFCPDCGEFGEIRGHMGCQFPH